MTSYSGTSSGSCTQLPNLGSDGDLQAVMDQKKRKRMLSNRESARRSRMRKQKHVDELMEQVSQLKKENGQVLTTLNLTAQNYLVVEAENSVLRTQMLELTSRLNSLSEILQYLNLNGISGEPYMRISESLVNLSSFLCINQPLMASSDMINYY